MKKLPETENALLVRTDFSDEAAWEAVRAAVEAPGGEYRAYVEFVSDPGYGGVTAEKLPGLMPEGYPGTAAFLVDREALANPEHPILVVDLCDQPGRTFRVIPSEMASVENNLTIANMDFDEFAEAAGPDGVFRGFPEPGEGPAPGPAGE
jgi:hypothetical protein